MKKQISHVYKFHEAFGIANEAAPKVEIDERIYHLRHRLMAEENDEYLQAAKAGNMVEVADALGDMLYILCGTILSHGMQDVIEDVFDEIQRSNMSKLDANGNPIYREDGKVLKSELYFRPNIAAVLSQPTVLNNIAAQ
jgi:predicted HAD superfamily Cof-like phosphohydrolase